MTIPPALLLTALFAAALTPGLVLSFFAGGRARTAGLMMAAALIGTLAIPRALGLVGSPYPVLLVDLLLAAGLAGLAWKAERGGWLVFALVGQLATVACDLLILLAPGVETRAWIRALGLAGVIPLAALTVGSIQTIVHQRRTARLKASGALLNR